MQYSERLRISNTIESIVTEWGMTPEEIAQGDCAVFAKKLVDALGKGIIVNGLNASMQDELEGYETQEPSIKINRNRQSHCWVAIDGWFFDAFDSMGVDEENMMQFLEIL